MKKPRKLSASPFTLPLQRSLASHFLWIALAAIAVNAPGAAQAGPKHDQGTWSHAYTLFPLTASPYTTSWPANDISVHTALLRGTGSTAKLIHWGTSFTARSWVYDPAARDQQMFDTTLATPIATTTIPISDGSEIFCSGHSVLEDGRLMVLGGSTAPGWDGRDPLFQALRSRGSYNVGPRTTYAFDPATASASAPFGWSRLADFSEGRWYPTATTLGDGTLLLSGGNQGNLFTVFGGETGNPSTLSGDFRVLQDFITFNPITPLTTANPPPSARSDYGAAFDFRYPSAPGSRMVIFGGRTSTGFTNELWAVRRYDSDPDPTTTESWRWSNITPSGTLPPPRAYTDAVYDNNVNASFPEGSLVMIGGTGNTPASPTSLGDAWRFKFDARNPGTPDANTGVWVQISSGGPFEARSGHSSVLIANPAGASLPSWVVILFGYNHAVAPSQPHYVDDGTSLWVLDLNTQTWLQKTVDADPVYGRPALRRDACAAYLADANTGTITDPNQGDCVIVFGGKNDASYFNDTWRLNLKATPNWKWQKIGPSPDCSAPDCLSASPPARARAGIGLDQTQRHRVVIFGGENASGKLSDAWALPIQYYVLEASAKDQWLPITMNVSTEPRAGVKAVWNNPGWTSRHIERFDPIAGTWSTYSQAPMYIGGYPSAFQLPEDGKVFFASPGHYNRGFDPTGTGAWTNYVLKPAGSDNTDVATAVMFRPGQVMRCGSWLATTTTETVDLTSGNGTSALPAATDPPTYWAHDPAADIPPNEGRYHHNLTILPNGNVFMTGGTFYPPGPNGVPLPAPSGVGRNSQWARRDPFMWTPDPDPTKASGTWSQMQTEPVARGYHSTAVLLPDARVLTSGGSSVAAGAKDINGADFGIDPGSGTAEIYTPGYLYTNDASDAPIRLSDRPQITSCPSTLTYATSPATFTVNVTLVAPRTAARVCLIRNGAVTHSVGMDQRYIPLFFTQSGGVLTVYKLTIPYGRATNGYTFADPAKGPRVAPPGTYMLFVVDDLGVPSVASWVKIDPVAPAAAPIDVSNTCTTISASWVAPGDDGNIGTAAAYDFRISTSAITAANFASATPVSVSPPQVAGTVEPTHTYGPFGPGVRRYFGLKTTDAAGNVSGLTTAWVGTPNVPFCDDGGLTATIEPKELRLLPPRPSPAFTSVDFEYLVPEANGGESVRLDVFDAAGRRVFGTDPGQTKVGRAVVTWDLRDQRGARVHSGLYFVRLQVGKRRLDEKLIVN